MSCSTDVAGAPVDAVAPAGPSEGLCPELLFLAPPPGWSAGFGIAAGAVTVGSCTTSGVVGRSAEPPQPTGPATRATAPIASPMPQARAAFTAGARDPAVVASARARFASR